MRAPEDPTRRLRNDALAAIRIEDAAYAECRGVTRGRSSVGVLRLDPHKTIRGQDDSNPAPTPACGRARARPGDRRRRRTADRPDDDEQPDPLRQREPGHDLVGPDHRPAGGRDASSASTSARPPASSTALGSTQPALHDRTPRPAPRPRSAARRSPGADRHRRSASTSTRPRPHPRRSATPTRTCGSTPNDGARRRRPTAALAYAAGDPNAGANPNVVGSAYTNNFAGATTTTLYGIDSDLDILVDPEPAEQRHAEHGRRAGLRHLATSSASTSRRGAAWRSPR